MTCKNRTPREIARLDWVRKCWFRVSKLIRTVLKQLLENDIDILMSAGGINSYTMCVCLWVNAACMQCMCVPQWVCQYIWLCLPCTHWWCYALKWKCSQQSQTTNTQWLRWGNPTRSNNKIKIAHGKQHGTQWWWHDCERNCTNKLMINFRFSYRDLFDLHRSIPI